MNKPDQALASVAKAACTALVAGIGAFVLAQPASAASIDNGKSLVEAHNCAACHGPGLNKPVTGQYPKLAGQYADYVHFALRQYQMGKDNPRLGRGNAIMQAQVQSLSDGDMKDIAAYIQSLPGDLVQKK